MFVQFIEGSVSDPRALQRQFERWQEQCADGATGWLGTTAGVTADSTAFVAARFASAEDARANSDRPEQAAWWAETQPCFEGTVSFVDCDDVTLFREGGSDEAGFVQVIRGQVNDIDAAREVFAQDMPDEARPDVLGGMVGMMPDGTYTTVVYFTSEADARVGEADEAEGGVAEQMDALHDAPPRFLDLAEPWLQSA